MSESTEHRWKPSHKPHVVIGGKMGGGIVDYRGPLPGESPYHYTLPGVLSFMPLYVEADGLVPITVDEANFFDARRMAEFRRARALAAKEAR